MPNNLDALTFSEADKSSHAKFDKDATGIIWAVKNREARPERFGETRDEVIFAPNQFTGVGGNEWNKVMNNKLTEDEQWYAKRAAQLRNAIDKGLIKDPTGGADHYVNPKLADPNWAKVYKKTYSSGSHNFHSELEPVKKNKSKTTFKKAFANARKAGKDSFSWNGKDYTTELAE